MKANSFRALGLSSKLSQLCALLSLVTLVIYCIYGAMYDYLILWSFLPWRWALPVPSPMCSTAVSAAAA